jgi:hypothetical protein
METIYTPNPTLPWNTNPLDIPEGKAILVQKKGNTVPFMAAREGDQVQVLLMDDDRGYGWYADLTDLQCWLDVCDLTA